MSGVDRKMRVPLSSVWITFVTVVLAVLDNTISDQLPVFDDTPVNASAIAGHTAVLYCSVTNIGKHEVVWLNPKKILISKEDRRLMDDTRMSIERPEIPDWNLHIRHVRYDDRGMYVCLLNTNPVSVKRIYLNVYVEPDINELWSSGKQVVREGFRAELHCNATGEPQPTITWFRKTKYKRSKEALASPGEFLIIHNITRHCGGIYECVASNGIGDAVSMEIEVEVNFKPEVRLLNKKISQEIGKETILACEITASPQGEAYWRKGKVKLAPSKSSKYRSEVYKDEPDTVSLSLVIHDLDVSDFGVYTCEGTNHFGRDSEDVFLYEYRKLTTMRSTEAPKTTNYRPDKGNVILVPRNREQTTLRSRGKNIYLPNDITGNDIKGTAGMYTRNRAVSNDNHTFGFLFLTILNHIFLTFVFAPVN